MPFFSRLSPPVTTSLSCLWVCIHLVTCIPLKIVFRFHTQVITYTNMTYNYLYLYLSYFTKHVPVYLLRCFSHVLFFVSLWIVAHQAPLSTGFSRQEYWRILPSSRGSSWSRDQAHVSCTVGGFFTHWATWESHTKHNTLWVHPCCCKWQNFILFDGWVIFHCVCVCVCVCVYTHLNTSSCTSAHVYIWHVQKSSPSCRSGGKSFKGNFRSV